MRACLCVLHRILLVSVSVTVAATATATATVPDRTDIPCGAVERDNIHIDGLLSDWDGVSPLDLETTPGPGAERMAPARPFGASLRCDYDDRAMYLLIEVTDAIVVRTRAAGLGEDHVELGIVQAGGTLDRLLLWPGVPSSHIPRSARWASGHPLRLVEGEGPAGRPRPLAGAAFEVYDTLEPHGYAIELRLPFKLLPGYHPGVALPFGVRVVDVDSRARPEPVAVAQTSPLERAAGLSRVLFDEAQSGLTAVLNELHLGEGDIWWERTADLGSGPARVMMIGRYLAVVGKQYGYQEVAQARGDILDQEVRLVDLGAGQAVAVQTLERGGGGSRQVLRLYRLLPSGFKVIFAAELGKQQGQGRLSTQLSYVRRGKATDIVLQPRPAVGFTAATYQEAPADDMDPILLPWRDKRARYVYSAKTGTYSRAD